ncbi:hypothetical protein [Carboxylicivirga sp. N1Y90]|uniref:hypothetical protein n=1 Tax=Carboxylicivirga fragile TaxID=3417571 RepID=UPI003D34C4EE|nr:hypothetical protein [Marinilabiliaceae bacterium N1Y90]
MNTKTCLNCSASFTPKRSDAICCSDKCRAAYNYQKKQRKNSKSNLPTIAENAQNQEKEIVIKGDIDTTFLISKAKECETKMELINSEIAQIETLKTEYSAQILKFQKEILTIETGDKAKLVKRHNLSDLALYNNYLNSAYLTEKKKGNEFAHNRLKSESDLTNAYSPNMRISVENYRSNIISAINKHDLEITNFQQQIVTVKTNIDQYCAKIKELQSQLRFYEARVLKYETLLLSV